MTHRKECTYAIENIGAAIFIVGWTGFMLSEGTLLVIIFLIMELAGAGLITGASWIMDRIEKKVKERQKEISE